MRAVVADALPAEGRGVANVVPVSRSGRHSLIWINTVGTLEVRGGSAAPAGTRSPKFRLFPGTGEIVVPCCFANTFGGARFVARPAALTVGYLE